MGIRLTPITRITVPVTTGGKKRSIRLITGARKIEITPAPITAPNSARAPSAPGAAPAMATMGPTAAKVTPIITGILTPSQGPAPSDWMIEAMPQTNRSAEIRKATSSGGSCSARPTISGTAIAPAYITRTCCNPSVNRRGAGSMASTGCTPSRR